ncbi:NfeD family protein [Halalkalicoccus sp. NIPERK01]|uniref:NfeD family protein n=1 Tax=Halalkalicoccus sp. NIPERK01 TaxID=3053469 RepID=UPI00256F0B45|nr:NfeD family protein [Halalkalicoccus sp. NIPERK01]MDL5361742.1 NfeD family protein [Halalkalicoccus sp. NIPERK01]
MVEILGESLPLVLLVVGVILTIAEAIAPGAHLIVLGVALVVAGLVGLALGPFIGGGALAVALAATVLLVGGVALFAYRELDIYGGKGAGRTSDSDSLRGRTGRVTERVTPSGGQVKLTGGFNPYYTARSIDGTIEEGEEVFVIDPGGGNVLTVESLGVVEDEIDRELDLGRVTDDEDAEREPEYDLEK